MKGKENSSCKATELWKGLFVSETVQFSVAGTLWVAGKGWEVKLEGDAGTRMQGFFYWGLRRMSFPPNESKWRLLNQWITHSKLALQMPYPSRKGWTGEGEKWVETLFRKYLQWCRQEMQRDCRASWPLSPAGEQGVSDATRGRRGRAAAWGKLSMFA